MDANMKEPIIIKELGKVYGRDAIYLDKIEFDGTHTVKLFGDFNGTLCENVKDSTSVSYELIFTGLLEFKITELDFFSQSEHVSSFEIVTDSERIKEFLKSSQSFKVKDSHKHILFHTYDDVIEVIANGFEMKLKSK